MPFEPISPLGGFTGLAEPQEPQKFTDVNPETRPFQPPAESVWDSAFRLENTIGSSIVSEDVRESREQAGVFGGSVKIDPDFDPWAEIAGTAYEPYYEQFARAGNKAHFEAIRADIDRENKDRDVISKSGWTGIGASMAAGTLDWPLLIPGGAVIRSAGGGVSLLGTAATTATAGTVAAAASETVLQGSQQLRTGMESAVVIGGSTVLAGLLGAGFGKLFSRAEMARLSQQVEQDFRVPGLNEPDPFSPGGFRVEAAPGASPKAQEVAAAIRETAEQILPPSVRVQVVDEIEAVLGGQYSLREDLSLAPHATMPKMGKYEVLTVQRSGDDVASLSGRVLPDEPNVFEIYNIQSKGNRNSLGTSFMRGLVDAIRERYPQVEFIEGYRVSGARPQASQARVKLPGKQDRFSIRAFHGSPHDFDEFSLSKIGTGEGAQVYGHGLYFAESDQVARHYQVNLSQDFRLNGEAIIDDELRDLAEIKASGVSTLGQTLDGVEASYREMLDRVRADKNATRQQLESIEAYLDKIKTVREGKVDATGNLYEVDIDVKPEDLLDWDAPVRSQSEKVRDSLRKAAQQHGLIDPNDIDRSVQAFMQHLSRKVGGSDKASEALREAGISGIRYLDAGSRGTGDGSRNIVIFDDKLVSITKKNGEPLTKAERKEIIDEMFGLRQQDGKPIIEGKFDPEQSLIQISAAALDPAKTLRHEAVHALRSLGLFAGKEWKTLEAAAKKQGWMESNNVRQLYEEIYAGRTGGDDARLRDMLTEEAIAEQYSLWKQGANKVTGTVAKLFQRIKDFLERTGNALQGQGFRTADDVFGAIESGGVAGRGTQTLPGLPGAASGGARSVGAAARDSVDNTLKSAFGMEKATAFAVPELRLFTSPSQVTRRYGQELFESALTWTKNKAGNETAPLGTELGSPGAVETRVKFWSAPLAEAVQAVDNAFLMYRKGRQKRMVGELSATTLKDTIFGTNALTYPQFKEQVSKALRRGDAHEIPEIAQAAKTIRATVLDPLKDEAIALKMLPEDVTPETAASYLNRIYNRERIIAERDQFKSVVRNWPDETETNNSAVRARLSTALETLKEAEVKQKKLDARIAKKEQRFAELEKAAEEVTSFNKFATERSMKLSEPLDTVRSDINAISTRIAEPLEQIADLTAQIRETKDTIPGLRDVERQLQTLSRALSDVNARTEFIEQMDDAIDIEHGLENLTESFREVMHRLRSEGRELKAATSPQPAQLTGQEKLLQNAAWSNDYGTLKRVAAEEFKSGPKRLKDNPEALAAFKRMAKNVRALVKEGDQGDFTNARKLLARALRDSQELDEAAPGPVSNLYSQWVRNAARNQNVNAEEAFQGPGEILKALEAERTRLGKRIAPFREQLRNMEAEARKLEKRNNPKAREGNVYRTKIRGRVNTLRDQLSGRRGELDTLRFEQEQAAAKVEALQKGIEDEVVKYQGKSAKEAQRALETRTEAEGARDADAPRLRAADKPVLAAARKISRQVDKEAGEIDDLADQIIDRIIGTPDGRLPYDAHMDTKTVGGVSQQVPGPLNARVFMIPDKLIEPWLENDIDALLRSYVRSMAPDIELTKRFGSADMKLQMKEITEDYAKRSAAAKTPKERKKVNDQKNADLRDLAAVRDRLRGTYALPSNPDGMMVRAGRVVGALNFMRMLGGMTISAIPDIARPVMVHGMMRTFGDGLFPVMASWSTARLAMSEVKMAGTALDMVLDSRAMRIADVMDEFGRHTKFERAVHSGARNFGVVSLMAPWNAAMKQFVGLITMSRILKATDALARAKIKPKDMEALTAGGISTGNAVKIAEQMKKYGTKQGTVWLPNTHLWDADAKPAMEAFRAALVRDVDRIVVTPGIADRPLWMSSEMGRLIGQFKSFALASMQKTTIAALQQRDAGTLAGAAMMIGLGGLVHVIKARSGDHDPGIPKQWGMNDETSQFMVNAVDRSGLMGWLMEANAMTEKATAGAIGLSALTGKQVGRYASRNWTAGLAGPTFGTAQDFGRVMSSGFSEWSQTDTRVARRLLPYNNIFYLRRLFDNAEKGINDYLGVPERGVSAVVAPARSS